MIPADYRAIGTRVYSRDGSECGLTTGSTRPCTMEGCSCARPYVKWPDGNTTIPCSGGLKPHKNGWRII